MMSSNNRFKRDFLIGALILITFWIVSGVVFVMMQSDSQRVPGGDRQQMIVQPVDR